MAEDILIPLAFFVMVGTVFWIIFHNGQKKQAAFHETVRKAIEAGSPLSQDLIQALGTPRKANDLRRGLILLALGVACVIFGVMLGVGDRDPFEEMAIGLGIGAFPGLIGLVLIGYHFLAKNQDD